MGEDGCDRFQWAYDDLGKGAPQTPLQTSSPRLNCSWTPAIVSSHESPKKHALATIRHRTLSTNISPPSQHHTPSVELSERFEPLTYA